MSHIAAYLYPRSNTQMFSLASPERYWPCLLPFLLVCAILDHQRVVSLDLFQLEFPLIYAFPLFQRPQILGMIFIFLGLSVCLKQNFADFWVVSFN